MFDQASIQFDWHESDRSVAPVSLERFRMLTEDEQSPIADSLIAPVSQQLTDSVDQVLELDLSAAPHLISGVEILIKTELNEMLLFQEPNIQSAVAKMMELMPERVDVSDLTS